jgi:hypothetical protein
MIEDCEYLDEDSETTNKNRKTENSDDDSESDNEKSQISQSTLEAATAAKVGIEKYYKNLFRSLYEREQRYTLSM